MLRAIFRAFILLAESKPGKQMTTEDWPVFPTRSQFNHWFKMLGVTKATPADVIVAWACYPHMKKAVSLITLYRERSKESTFTIDDDALRDDVEQWSDPDAYEPEEIEEESGLPDPSS
jgi:hypothetical protein